MWLKAIKAGYFKGLSGLTTKQVQKHIKVISDMEMGHINRVHQCQRSSKIPPQYDHMETPAQTLTNEKTPHLYDYSRGNGKNLQQPDWVLSNHVSTGPCIGGKLLQLRCQPHHISANQGQDQRGAIEGINLIMYRICTCTDFVWYSF